VALRIGEGYRDFGHDVLPALAADGLLTSHTLEPGGFCLGADTPERYTTARLLVANGQVAP
jgi:hypothetical protein